MSQNRLTTARLIAASLLSVLACAGLGAFGGCDLGMVETARGARQNVTTMILAGVSIGLLVGLAASFWDKSWARQISPIWRRFALRFSYAAVWLLLALLSVRADWTKAHKLKADGAVALNWFDYLDRTPLMWAVAENNQEMAGLLLQAGSNVNSYNEARIGDTALRMTAERGDSEMVKLLLDAGADPLIPGWMGLTAWDKAQDRRSAEGMKVRELIERTVRRRG